MNSSKNKKRVLKERILINQSKHKINKPSLSSLILISIFFWIRPSRFSNIQGTYEQNRFFDHIYNWEIFIPIFYTLLLFAVYEVYKYRKQLIMNVLSIVLVSPIILFKIYFLARISYNWITIWN